MRLIDSDWLLDKLSSDNPANMEDYYYNAIKEAPTIEAEPVRHRTWVIKIHDDGHVAYQAKHCPDCDRGLPVEYDADYCPKCGAKMDGGCEK